MASLGECGSCSSIALVRACTRCRKVAYCNSVCQKADWGKHRMVCGPKSQYECTTPKASPKQLMEWMHESTRLMPENLKSGRHSELSETEKINAEKAVDFVLKAAGGGLQDAQCTMGTLYASGIVVPKSFDKACHWWSAAAEQGSMNAQRNLGIYFFSDPGTSRHKAFKWLQLAANQNCPKSIFFLGQCY